MHLGLQILNQAIVSGASHNSSERFPPSKCHPQTRRAIIANILNWIRDSNRHTGILWLNGPAGAGKSSIAQTIAERCTESGHLAASFFFSRTSPVRSSVRQIFATIAYQLAFAFPPLKQIIEGLVEDDPSIVNKSIDLQFLQLILEPMQLVKQFESKVVIIDGLDECEDSDIQAYIIQLIGRACDQKLPVCFLIASRPERTREAQAISCPKIADLRAQNWANLCPRIADFRHSGRQVCPQIADLRAQLSRKDSKCHTMSPKARILLLAWEHASSANGFMSFLWAVLGCQKYLIHGKLPF